MEALHVLLSLISLSHAKGFPQYPLPKRSEPVFFSQDDQPKFTSIENNVCRAKWKYVFGSDIFIPNSFLQVNPLFLLFLAHSKLNRLNCVK
jgi:hypothetical protein